MKAMRWHRTFMRSLGRSGLVGLALLALIPALFLFKALPDREKFHAVQNDVRTLQKSLGKGEAATPEEELAEFYAKFPREEMLADNLEKVFSLARAQGVSLPKGAYKVVNEGNLVRFTMTFPVSGEYPKIRSFIFELLSQIPVLCLDGVSLKREKISDPAVESEIRMSLYLREKKP